jgi:rod shape-determining protein MreC
MWFAQPISYAVGLVQSLFSGISLSVRGTTAEYVNLINIKSENAKLLNQINEFKATHSQFQENLIELDRLRKLLEFKSKTKMRMVPAQVIGRDLTLDHQTITINKGTADGLTAQLAVVTTTGAVGYVFRPEEHSSHVMLLTDRYAVTDSVVQKTRSHAIIEGLGKDSASLQYVDRDEVMQVGDLIVTGGLDRIYPIGFPLAVVSEILKKPNSSTRIINVKPVVQSDKIEEVFVILSTENEDLLNKLDPKNEK